MRKGEERRAEIVRQAERLFCERGYEETSLEELLQAYRDGLIIEK